MPKIIDEIIYEDSVGKISAIQDKKWGGVTLFADHKDGLHEQISVPKDALEGIVFFLNKARGL